MERKIDPSNPSVTEIADYIHFLNTDLKTGQAVRTYFQTMKTELAPASLQLANCSSIRDLIATTVHNKPSLPLVPSHIWDADILIHYFIKLLEDKRLSNVMMSAKCILLLMLASGQRKADIMNLDVSPQHMKRTNDAYYCSMSTVSKGNFSGRKNFMQFIEFHHFDAEPKICPYRMLEDYIRLVRNTVGESAFNHTQLFVTTTSGTPAHRDTGHRWAADMLEDAGINMGAI